MLAALVVQILSVNSQICPLKDWLYNLMGVSSIIRLPVDEKVTYFIPLQAEIQTSSGMNQCDWDALYCYDSSKDLFASNKPYCYGEENTTPQSPLFHTTMPPDRCQPATCHDQECTFNEAHQSLESLHQDLWGYVSVEGTERSIADYSSLDCGVSITRDSVEFLPMETESGCLGELPHRNVTIDVGRTSDINDYTISFTVHMNPLSTFSANTAGLPVWG